MAKYLFKSRPQGTWWKSDNSPLLPNVDVPEHVPTFTGLYDVDGDPIMRQPRPIGFGRDEDW